MLRLSLACALGAMLAVSSGCRTPGAALPSSTTSPTGATSIGPTSSNTVSKAAPSQSTTTSIPETSESDRPTIVKAAAPKIHAEGNELVASPTDLNEQMTLPERTLAAKTSRAKRQSTIQQVAHQEPAAPAVGEARPAPQGVVISDDPAAVPGGPRYPKQQLPIEQSIPGVAAAIPVAGMVLGNCDCGPCGGASAGINAPLRQSLCGNNWKPEGLYCPWPTDEYLCDGGDNDARVRVKSDFTVTGMDIEDTVAHYDTVDGRTVVEPSNKVCIYAPRFAAVRRVDGLFAGEQHVKAGDYAMPIGPKRVEDNVLASTDTLPLAPIGEVGNKRVTVYDGRDQGVPLTQNVGVLAFQDRVHLNSDLKALIAYRLDESLKPFLAKKSLAAVTWTRDQMVQAVIDGKKAIADQGSQGVQAVYRVDAGKPRLRITKAASTDSANPGDIIEFVLRFDNIGEQTIGNVTLIDSLTTRLEYVEGSQQSSLNARFMTQQNAGESLILRWEVTDPIKAGDGGVIVFECKVR
ncbi:MAG: hypothetical protein QM811_27055 [Pirellulales bacterium]